MLKLVFAGTPDVAVPSLKAFAADPRFDVVGVITRPDAPTGRGRKLTPSPVKATALELGLPVIDLKPRSPEFMEALNDLHADIAAVIAYGNILPKNVLDAVAKALSEGTATSGVPANTSLSMVLLEMSMLTARPECSRHWR